METSCENSGIKCGVGQVQSTLLFLIWKGWKLSDGGILADIIRMGNQSHENDARRG
jgi:hypothetical protein